MYTVYEDNLISKIFVFQIVNSYASLVYISFVKNQVGYECLANSCTSEVSGTLSTLFISRLLTANITGILLPSLNRRKRDKEESSGLEPGVMASPIEKVTFFLASFFSLILFFFSLFLYSLSTFIAIHFRRIRYRHNFTHRVRVSSHSIWIRCTLYRDLSIGTR